MNHLKNVAQHQCLQINDVFVLIAEHNCSESINGFIGSLKFKS